MKDFSEHFRELVQGLLPPDSRVLLPSGGGDLIILATWRLTSDPTRPTKRSRMIRLILADEAVEDYARASDGLRLASDSRLLALLKDRLAAFDPNHDSPRGVNPPAVTWTVTTLDLNG
jgi:hypothetical protein